MISRLDFAMTLLRKGRIICLEASWATSSFKEERILQSTSLSLSALRMHRLLLLFKHHIWLTKLGISWPFPTRQKSLMFLDSETSLPDTFTVRRNCDAFLNGLRML